MARRISGSTRKKKDEPFYCCHLKLPDVGGKGIPGSWGLGGEKESVLFFVPLDLDLEPSPATIKRNPAKNETGTGIYRARDGPSSHDITEVPRSSQA